jgi:hypothetical protein
MLKDYITPGSVLTNIGCDLGYFSFSMEYLTGPHGKDIRKEGYAEKTEENI